VPTIQQNPGDVLWIVGLASGTTYPDRNSALIAATALSAANSNASVQLGDVQEVVSAPNAPILAQVNLATQLFVIQLATGTTYIPLETARVAAYALSAANANAPVNVSHVLELVTAP
jgi:glucose-6-phosphate isomerase